MTIIAKNNTAGSIYLEEFGIDIAVSGQRTLTDEFSVAEICSSGGLKTLVSASSIVINDGTSDLSASDGIKAITITTEYIDSEGSGGGWTVSSTSPSSPSNGDGWYNTGSNTLYYYDGTRAEWLSMQRYCIAYGLTGQLKGAYFAIGSNVNPNSAGASFAFDTILVEVVLLTDYNTSGVPFQVEIDGSSAFAFTTDANGQYFNSGVDVDMSAYSIATFICTSTSPSVVDGTALLTFVRKG